MRKNQQGLTYIGWVLAVAGSAFLALIVVRVLPMYMDYFKLVAAFDSIKSQSEGSAFSSREEVRKAVRNRIFYIDDVETIKQDDIKISRVKGGFEASADYNACADIIYNLSLCAKFSDKVVVNGRSS